MMARRICVNLKLCMSDRVKGLILLDVLTTVQMEVQMLNVYRWIHNCETEYVQ